MTSADPIDVLVDTSVDVPLVIADHPAHEVVVDKLGDRVLGIAGGAVYDALVAAAAHEHGVVLATRDRNAVGTYRAIGVRIEVIG